MYLRAVNHAGLCRRFHKDAKILAQFALPVWARSTGNTCDNGFAEPQQSNA
jgi:hypothetical protein